MVAETITGADLGVGGGWIEWLATPLGVQFSYYNNSLLQCSCKKKWGGSSLGMRQSVTHTMTATIVVSVVSKRPTEWQL